jgi:hypothetical protein
MQRRLLKYPAHASNYLQISAAAQILADLDPSTAREAATLLQAANQHRTPRLGPLMSLLDNSPILAAYGMVRSGCCEQSRSMTMRARGLGALAAAAASRRPSPFQKQQQQQQQQMLVAILGASGDVSGGGAEPAAPFYHDPDSTASVARALEMMYYGDQAGLDWEGADYAGRLVGSSSSKWNAQLRAHANAAAAADGAAGPYAATEVASTSGAGGPYLSPMLSAPCGSNGLPGRPGRSSMRTIAARHLPLRSARSLRAALRESPSGESARSGEGARAGVVRWADVAGMRAKVRG